MSSSPCLELPSAGPCGIGSEQCGEFQRTKDPDDVTDGLKVCRSVLQCVSSVAAAAEKESQRLLSAITDDKEGLAAVLLSCANVLSGVDGSSDALKRIFSSTQLHNQKLRTLAAELTDCSKKMRDISSDSASMLSDAVNALEESRSALDRALYRFAFRKQLPDHPRVQAVSAAFETEIERIRFIISHVQCICRACVWRCGLCFAGSRFYTFDETELSEALSRSLPILELSAKQYEACDAMLRPDLPPPTPRTTSASLPAAHSTSAILTLLCRCSPKFISAFLSSTSTLQTSEAVPVQSALMRVLDDCDRAEEILYAMLTDASHSHKKSRAGNPCISDAFVVTSSEAPGALLSGSLHLAGGAALTLLLHPLITTIASEQAWFEIDPHYTEQGESIDANAGNLERACQWFLDTILVSLKDIPQSCRQLLALVASCFKDHGLKTMCQAASLCFFYQLVIPCILNPVPAVSPPESQMTRSARSLRAFKYIADALAAVVSNLPFDANSDGISKYMSSMNSFIVRNAPRTLVAFEPVISSSSSPSTPRSLTALDACCDVNEVDDIRLISEIIMDRKEYIGSWLSAQGLNDDLALMAELFGPLHTEDLMFPKAGPGDQSQIVGSDTSDGDISDSTSVCTDGALNHIFGARNAPFASASAAPPPESLTASPSACGPECIAASPAASAAAHAPGASACVFEQSDMRPDDRYTVSADTSSLSPVSFLVQSHTGILPPVSPLSRQHQNVTKSHVQDAGVVAASRQISHFPEITEVRLVGQKQESDELEALLQHQLLSEHRKKFQQQQQQQQQQQRKVDIPPQVHPDRDIQNQQQLHIAQHTILRVPLTPPQLLATFVSAETGIVDVIKPHATRLASASASGSLEDQQYQQQLLMHSIRTKPLDAEYARISNGSSTAGQLPGSPEEWSSLGVGIKLKRNGRGMLSVRAVDPRSSCHDHIAGRIEVGDVLLAVDGVKADGKNIHEVFQTLLQSSGSGMVLRLQRTSQADPALVVSIDLTVESQRVGSVVHNRVDPWDDQSSVSSGSSLASMRSDTLDAEVSCTSSVSALAAHGQSSPLVSSLSCGIGMLLRRNRCGQYFIRGLSGASRSFGVFNIGDQVMCLDGTAIDGLSSRTVCRKMNGTIGSALNVTIRTHSLGPFCYSCRGSNHILGETFRTTIVRSNPDAASEFSAYIGVGVILKRAAETDLGRGAACYVLCVREGSPAAAAGVAIGNVLVSVDGIRVKNRSPSAVALLLQGPAHAEVELVLQRSSAVSVDGSDHTSLELNQYKVRLQRRPLVAPDVCLDFLVNNRPSPLDLAAAAAGRCALAVASSTPASVYSSAADQIRRSTSPSVQQGVGFGMNLKRDSSGSFFVKRLDPLGPSAVCGKISVGDECLTIDGVALKGKSYSALSRLVVGAPNSTVELQTRGAQGGAVKKVLINRRSNTPSALEGVIEEDRSSSRCTPEAASPHSNERLGIGATFCKSRNGLFEVGQLVLGGPAEIIGIQVGDAVVEVDGVSVIGASTEWFTDSILGVPGSTVTLKFQRRSRGRPAPGMIESVVVLTRGGNAT